MQQISKFLGMYSSNRLYTDWCMAVPEEKTKNTQWCDFVKAMTPYYKPTENIMLKHFHFWSNMQNDGETFIVFCNGILVEARQYNFKGTSVDCIIEGTAVSDQINIT